MRIAIAADHGGYALKQDLITYLEGKGNTVIDCGTGSEASVDYPDFAEKGCNEYLNGNADFTILCCGTGVGISIAANKIKGIRCGLCPSVEIARLVKQHNNANAIALGGRTTSPELAREIVDAYMSEEFLGGRHQNRIDKISALENKNR